MHINTRDLTRNLPPCISQIFLDINILVNKRLYTDILIGIIIFNQVGIRSCTNIFCFPYKAQNYLQFQFKKKKKKPSP